MKKYLITFRNEITSAIFDEVEVERDEKTVEKAPSLLVLSALIKMKNEGKILPNKILHYWSYREL